jgi:hypothetical protein
MPFHGESPEEDGASKPRHEAALALVAREAAARRVAARRRRRGRRGRRRLPAGAQAHRRACARGSDVDEDARDDLVQVRPLLRRDGTFAEVRRLCIHDHEVARQGAWNDPRACWLNALYSRTVPSHAIEMTAANLHEAVSQTLVAQRRARATLDQKQRLAAVIHLCGRERGAAFARRGFWVVPGERCGDHDVALYLRRVEALRKAFARMGAPIRARPGDATREGGAPRPAATDRSAR